MSMPFPTPGIMPQHLTYITFPHLDDVTVRHNPNGLIGIDLLCGDRQAVIHLTAEDFARVVACVEAVAVDGVREAFGPRSDGGKIVVVRG